MYKVLSSTLKARKSADIVIVPIWEAKKQPQIAALHSEFASCLRFPLSEGDFSGKEKETLFFYRSKGKEKRLLLLGLGREKDCNPEKLRSCYSAAMKAIASKPFKSVNVLLPGLEESQEAMMEGFLMAGYRFDQLKTKKPKAHLKQICFCGDVDVPLVKRIAKLMEAVYFTQDLVNANADEMYAETFKQIGKGLAQEYSAIKTTILDRKALEKEKMGLILAVGRGSSHDPAVVIMEYRGNPNSKEKVGLVGKGVTFDTGGLNLKVGAASIETMKCDMAGAASVVGVIKACAELKLNVNVVGAIGVTENAIGPKSYKPGDVYVSHSGKTVEITNTDAEGRLVLADTLSYLEAHHSLTHVIDLATLTGSIVVALGEEAAGLFCNSDQLTEKLQKAAENTHERVWRMPLYPEYRDQMKSPIADLKNAGSRKGGSATAAAFLHSFVKSRSWAHLDIAGVAYLSELKPSHPTYATGFGVRLLVDFLAQME